MYGLPLTASKLGTNVPRNKRSDGSAKHRLKTRILCSFPPFSLILGLFGFFWGVVGCRVLGGVLEVPFAILRVSLFFPLLETLPFFPCFDFGFGVGFIENIVLVEEWARVVQVPGGAASPGAVHIPGGRWVWGRFPSCKKVLAICPNA